MSLIQVEITNACNLRCIYCDREREGTFFTDGRKHMSPAEFDHVLDELLTLPVACRRWRFSLCGLCEPLINPNFIELISNDKLNKFTVDMVTNSTLLSEGVVHEIIKAKSNLAVRVSLQSSKKDVMEGLQRGAKFEIVVENCKHLISHKDQFKWIKIQKLCCSQTDGDTKANFERLLGTKFGGNVEFHQKSGVNIMGLSAVAEWPKAVKNPNCKKFGKDIIINCWGDLTACCWDCTRLQACGNILRQPINDLIITSKREQQKKDLLAGSYNQLPVCAACLGVNHEA